MYDPSMIEILIGSAIAVGVYYLYNSEQELLW